MDFSNAFFESATATGKAEQDIEYAGCIAVDAVRVLGGLPEGPTRMMQRMDEREGERRPGLILQGIRFQFSKQEITVTEEVAGRMQGKKGSQGNDQC